MGSVAGRTVLITRAEGDAERWAARLARLGAKPIVFPCLVCEPIGDPETAGRLRAALAGADWLVLTSRRGAEAVADLLGVPPPPLPKLAAVGRATAQAAAARLRSVDLVASLGTGLSLAQDLAAALAEDGEGGGRVVVAAAEGGRRDLEDVLEPAGIQVVRVPVYRTIPAPAEQPRHDLSAAGVDMILLASPSAVVGLVHRAVLPVGAPVVTIGPATTAAARANGLAVAGQARHPDLDGLLEAIP